MDVEILINLVYEKNPLWDMTDKAYHMRDIQRLWQEVAVEIGAKVDEVKNKWRGLRDTFRKEFNKSKKRKSGDGAESVVSSKWPYYKMMLFLSNVLERRKLHGNVSPQKNISNSDSETETNTPLEDENQQVKSTIQEWPQQDTQHPSQLGTQTTSILNTSSRSSGHKKNPKNRLKNVDKKGSIEDKFLEIEKSKLEILSHRKNREDNDSEYQFLMSLLPFLRSVPRNRQMLVRHKLQEVFLQEEQISTRHAPLSSYNNCNETVKSTPVPSPMSRYIHSDSSNYSNQCPSFIKNLESAGASHSCSIDGRENVSIQQLQSIRNYVSNFSE